MSDFTATPANVDPWHNVTDAMRDGDNGVEAYVTTSTAHPFAECSACASRLLNALIDYAASRSVQRGSHDYNHGATVKHNSNGAGITVAYALRTVSAALDTLNRTNDEQRVISREFDEEDIPNHPANQVWVPTEEEMVNSLTEYVHERLAERDARPTEAARAARMIKDGAWLIEVHEIERLKNSPMGNPAYRLISHRDGSYRTAANISDAYTITSGSPALGEYLITTTPALNLINQLIFIGPTK